MIDIEKSDKALNQTFLTAKMMYETMDDRNVMINCMIANTLIKNDLSTFKIFKQIKEDSS